MLATSTLVKPQQALLEIFLQVDTVGNMVSPAYFSPEVIKFMLNRKLIALESYYDEDMKVSPSFPKIPVITAAMFARLALTLLRQPGNGDAGGDFYKTIPLQQMRRIINGQQKVGSATDLWRCNPIEISWSDSSVNTVQPLALQGVTSVPFLATFLLPEQSPVPYLVNLKH